jgi:hypothetical protein
MNDFQLTMLAAKAAGFEVTEMYKFVPLQEQNTTALRVSKDGEPFHKIWDPLKINGYALELVVILKLDIDMNERSVSVWVNQKTSPVTEEFGDNEAAAVRRAIVRAAALIGEAL